MPKLPIELRVSNDGIVEATYKGFEVNDPVDISNLLLLSILHTLQNEEELIEDEGRIVPVHGSGPDDV